MTDRTIKAKNPWFKNFVLNIGAPKLDDAQKARLETSLQLRDLREHKRAYNSKVLK